MGDRAQRKTFGFWVLAAALAALLCLAISAAQDGDTPVDDPPPDIKATEEAPAADDAPATEDEEDDEPIYIEWADHARREPDPEDPENQDKGLYYLNGNVHIRHKDAELYCDECVYNAGDDTARCVGNLLMEQPDTTVTGDLLTADFDEEKAVVTGNVRMVYQKTKDDAQEGADAEPVETEEKDRKAEAAEKKTVVTCEKLTSWYEEGRAVAEGNVVAVQEDKTVYADKAVHLKEEDTLTLTGDPVEFTQDNGDSGEAPTVVIHIEDERLEATGGFTGIFNKPKKDDETTDEPAPETPDEDEKPPEEDETPPEPSPEQ
ncbi:MAG TPA: OstA-like protein [Armatimonadota bacterium]|nr:OstA-like protein [Armatimonadota bacterium]